MAKKESVTITIDAKTNSFPINHYFNRFSVESAGDGVFVELGYQGSDSFLRGLFSFFMPNLDIDRQKENILRYVDAIDFDLNKQKKVSFPLSERPVHTVRFMRAGRTGQHAELLLYNIPVFQEVEAPKNPENGVIADPIAAFSSPLSVHIELLKSIYVGL